MNPVLASGEREPKAIQPRLVSPMWLGRMSVHATQ